MVAHVGANLIDVDDAYIAVAVLMFNFRSTKKDHDEGFKPGTPIAGSVDSPRKFPFARDKIANAHDLA
jgi:hypothetical protein